MAHPDPDWWRGAVIYQIYPRSFQDSNGDGIGDLPGITQRLAHVASLGVDAIWISPFFPSPMKDFGYDVSDYCGVDPMFGTLRDFDALVARAHELGLKVLIDLVLSHTSDQHPWFRESRTSRDNAKANWYVWADAKPDGTPPNNWLSIFGGPAWQWDTRRQQYYLHNFLAAQPDLNFHAEEVVAAVLAAAQFWLDRGVDGFRLDTVNFYYADPDLRDNPALPPERRRAVVEPLVNPYSWQDHVNSKNRPETLGFLRRLRALMDAYPGSTTLGEIGESQRGLELLGEYTSGGDKLHMSYAFEFLSPEPLTAIRVADVLAKAAEAAPDGWPCWAFSNHDVARHVSRWNLTPAAARAMITLLVCLPGSICIYQGSELGLPEADVAFEDLQDPYGIEFWPEYKGRDGCRTPMVWTDGVLNAGFSAGHPWLPIAHEHKGLAVETAENDPGALLHHYRRAIAYRHAHPALARGRLAALGVLGEIVTFERVHDTERLFFALNMSDTPHSLPRPAGDWRCIGAGLGTGASQDGPLTCGPWEAYLLKSAEPGGAHG
ncbi:MAG TPA: alpha-glucosidase [Rhodobacteraceae bacterium]|jgi:alpha-glucosidase|nr:DUF3459 domain-containing protein [Paracoccaceae bacterium]HBG97421.1 alpha-glucosidase [Paracoccaceae bacterium]